MADGDLFNIVVAIAGTSGAGALIAGVTNKLIKRREEYVDISKYKINEIAKTKSMVIRWGRRNTELVRKMKAASRASLDYPYCFFCICQILYLRWIIYEEHGFQLDDLRTENLLHDFGTHLRKSMLKIGENLDEHDLSEIIHIAHDNTSIAKLDACLKYDANGMPCFEI